MTSETLLYWLTDRGEGSWQQFKTAVESLGGSNASNAWYRFATHGFIELFYGRNRQWAIRDPMAFIYNGQVDTRTAIVTGARTPDFVSAVRNCAEAHACGFSTVAVNDLPCRICVAGSLEGLEHLAAELNIHAISDASDYFCRIVRPIWQTIKESERQDSVLVNWMARSFDFATMSWVEGISQKTACEFTSRFGVKRYFFHPRHGQYLQMSRSEAIYSAAATRGISLASFDSSSNRLKVSTRTGLPIPFAFWAAMAGGSQIELIQDSFQYKMDLKAAQLLLAYLGQPPSQGP